MARMYLNVNVETIVSAPYNIEVVNAFKTAFHDNSVCPFLENSAIKYTSDLDADFSGRKIINVKYFIFAFSVIFKKHLAVEYYDSKEYYCGRVDPNLNLWDDTYKLGENILEKNIPTIVSVSHNDKNQPSRKST